MKALIDPNESKKTGYRVCQIHETGFEVCDPLFWVDCDDTIIADLYWFNPIDNSFNKFSIEELNENGINKINKQVSYINQTGQASANQPTTIGIQTI
jgi:hypothetical protein